jgi:hypothetical protein
LDPVVPLGAVLGVAELAAGSPVVDPRPLAGPLCAIATVLENAIMKAIAAVFAFMVRSFEFRR